MSDTFSYSKIEVYKKCPFKYKLIYIDGHKVRTENLATGFGSLVHYIEEKIGLDIQSGKEIDYNHYKDVFMNKNDEEALGVNELKNRYSQDWYEQDKQGFSCEDKMRIYLEEGIYKLNNFLMLNKNISVYALEFPFEITIVNKAFKGFIDRILYDSASNKYIIEDIKTYTKPLSKNELKESLQMYVYTKALKEIIGNDTIIECQYNLPLINQIQISDVDIKTINDNLESVFNNINNEMFYPIQSPLCHWCVFSKTYPNQPEEAKNLCPYFCHWTKERKTQEVENRWQGEERHKIILENFIKKETEIKD